MKGEWTQEDREFIKQKKEEAIKNGEKRTFSAKYFWIRAIGHPKASDGYVYEHVIIAEKALGKYLPDGAEIHHADGNRLNNQNSNLVICPDRAYHMLLHQRMRAYKVCGHADWRKCWICKKYDLPENLEIIAERVIYHKSCREEYRQKNEYPKQAWKKK